MIFQSMCHENHMEGMYAGLVMACGQSCLTVQYAQTQTTRNA